MARYLITTVPQADGGTRELYAATKRAASEAREELRNDPAMLDGLACVSEYVDVAADGTRLRFAKGGA